MRAGTKILNGRSQVLRRVEMGCRMQNTAGFRKPVTNQGTNQIDTLKLTIDFLLKLSVYKLAMHPRHVRVHVCTISILWNFHTNPYQSQ
jgi:hypothetical protein